MEKRAFPFVFAVCAAMLWGSAALAQEEAGAADPGEPGEVDEEAPAEEAPAEEAPAEEAPAEEAPAEEAPVEEAPAEEAPTEEAPAEEAPTEEAPAEAEKEDGEEEADGDAQVQLIQASLEWGNSVTAISFDKGHDYTYNPMYSMSFGLALGYNINKEVSLRTSASLSVELTDSDFSTKEHEPYFGDIPLTIDYHPTIEINDDVSFSTGLTGSALFPTSRMSQFATMYTKLGIGAKAMFNFPNVLSGLSIGWVPSFSKYFHESENPEYEGNTLDESDIPQAEKATSIHYQTLIFSAGENPSWYISNTLSLSLAFIDELSFSFSYTHRYLYKYSASNAYDVDEDSCSYTMTGCDPVRDTGYDERGLYFHDFMYDLSYTPVDVLTISLNAITSSNQLGPDGQYRTPFFNRETVIGLNLGFDLDAIYFRIVGDDEEKENGEESGEGDSAGGEEK